MIISSSGFYITYPECDYSDPGREFDENMCHDYKLCPKCGKE